MHQDAPAVVTVMGATGQVGAGVAGGLRDAGHVVRPVSQTARVSLDDRQGLRRAFEGAEAAYLSVPFDLTATDLHAREEIICSSLATAHKGSGVRRVVLLSGLNAHKKRGTSTGSALTEGHLSSLAIPEPIVLRAGWFMENLKVGLGFADQAATARAFSTPSRADRPVPMVSAADVAVATVHLLRSLRPPPTSVVEVTGSSDYSFETATDILAAALGLTEVTCAQMGYADARTVMLTAGTSPSFIDAVLVTARSFNDWRPRALQPRTHETTPTSLKARAQAALASPAAA